MSEFELQEWERELAAWRRRTQRLDGPPALEAELAALAIDISAVREQVAAGAEVSGARVARRLERLRALFEYLRPETVYPLEPAAPAAPAEPVGAASLTTPA
jgi:hypothetical protein